VPRKKVASAKPGKYRVVFERDESGAWIARAPDVRGCHTYGRTIDHARRRIREALGLWVDDAETAELVEEIRLPSHLLKAIRESRAARTRADNERAKAQAATAATARVLVKEFNLGLRDAAELLGLSHQRVQQLVRSSPG
jgi:predicted RNase H-like HicB family nuclease